MIRLAAVDMDGTLLRRDHSVSEYTANAIRRVRATGKKVAIATGRGITELTKTGLLDAIGGVDYILYENGASVYDAVENKVIAAMPIPMDMLEAFMCATDDMDCMVHMFTGDNVYMRMDESLDFTPYHVEHFRPVFHRATVFDVKLFDRVRRGEIVVNKVNAYVRTQEDRQKLMEEMTAVGFEIAGSIGIGLEFSAPGVNKGTALLELCRIAGIPIGEAMAVGDASNDMEIMKTAGLPVAMGNAQAEILALAKDVTGDCDEDGCAKALEKWMLGDEA